MIGVRTQRVLLESAARTASAATSNVTTTNLGNVVKLGPAFDYDAITARWYLNVTAASGTGGLTWTLRGYDKASGNFVVIAADSAAVVATGTYSFEIGIAPVAPSGNRRVAVSELLPVQWDVLIAAGDASSYTYSLSMETTS